MRLQLFIYRYTAVFELDTALGSRIVGSFFGTPGTIGSQVIDVVSFSTRLDNPHGNRGISKMCLVEMEYSFLGLDI